jgi:hypothetical protein
LTGNEINRILLGIQFVSPHPWKTKMPARELRFENLDDLRAEINRLNAGPYEQSGKWNLSQICNHLECWMRFPMDGFPRPPFMIAIIMKIIKVSNGQKMFRKILKTGKMNNGAPTAPETIFKPEYSTDRESVSRFLATIDRLERHTGPIHDSPLFGSMSIEECRKLQLIHCAHHLGFLVPGKAN